MRRLFHYIDRQRAYDQLHGHPQPALTEAHRSLIDLLAEVAVEKMPDKDAPDEIRPEEPHKPLRR